MFALGRLGLWYLAEWLDPTPPDPRAERPEVLLSLPLAPIGLLPLAAGDRLGDGAMLLAMAALLALLFVSATNLAAVATEQPGFCSSASCGFSSIATTPSACWMAMRSGL